jgi:hypothetical protein
VSDHAHTARPGEDECFVCGRDMAEVWAEFMGRNPSRIHEPVDREYGPDQVVQECRTCLVEWPCPAIKAINRQAKRARQKRKAARDNAGVTRGETP